MKISSIYKSIIFALLTTLIQNTGIACHCFPYEPVFCKNTTEYHNIIMAVVTQNPAPDYHLMEVKILENFNNGINEDTIIVLGQDGLNCGELLGQFNFQDTLILAVSEVEISGMNYYYLEGACGLHFLRYENGLVNGQITTSLTSQPIQDFRDNILECIEIDLPVENISSIGNKLQVFPNPVSDVLQIATDQRYIYNIEILNSSGQRILFRKVNSLIDLYKVNIDNLAKGIYFLRISTSKEILLEKFIKA